MEESLDFDRIAAEAKEQEILLDKGLSFKAGNRFFKVKQPYLGTLDMLAGEILKIKANREKLTSEDPMEMFEEQKRIMRPSARICARIVATAVLNNFWLLNFVTVYFLSRYFMWTVKPSDILKLTSIVIRASNLQDFTGSIILLSIHRTTAPTMIEE